jgi:pimeloyl-ACP methyl ester carboxylesterase
LYKSQTEISESQLIQDGETILNCMLERYRITPSRIIIVGRSLGSGVACALAARFRVGALILISPLKSIQEVAKEHYGSLTALLVKDRFNNAKYISQAQCPALIIHGPLDKLVPFAHAQELQSKHDVIRIMPDSVLPGEPRRYDTWDH